jgi:uncharacterized membrane protein
MNTGVLVKASFIGGIILALGGATLKILHISMADTWILAGLVLSFIFLVTALYEVVTSRRIERREKILWVLGFVFMLAFTGLYYLLSERRRIRAAA